MSIESFVQAMPKVDLNIQLEGAVHKDLLLMIAEQADIAGTYKKQKQFDAWVALLKEPDFNQIDEIARETAAWIRYPLDLARVVYELGVSLSKQNVRYAEVSVIPALYTDAGMTFQQFLDAINDGRDRVERAWQVRMQWVLGMQRERPRKSDDIARWATSVTAENGAVAALSLLGSEAAQPIAQFKKAFATAEKQELARITHIHSAPKADPFVDVLKIVNPQRLTDARDILDDADFVSVLLEHDLPLVLSPQREVCLGQIESIGDYPLRDLLDQQLNISVASGMPELYNATLTDIYMALAEQGNLSIEDIQELALNSVRVSLLPDDDKQAMLAEFQEEFTVLRDEHLMEEVE